MSFLKKLFSRENKSELSIGEQAAQKDDNLLSVQRAKPSVVPGMKPQITRRDVLERTERRQANEAEEKRKVMAQLLRELEKKK